MLIKIGKDHKKIDVSPLKGYKANVTKVISSGILLTISAFLFKAQLPDISSDYKEIESIVSNEYNFDNTSKVANIIFDEEIEDKDIYSKEELTHVTKISLFLKEDTDLSFLNYTPNLEELVIYINGYTNSLKTIDGSVFKRPIKIVLVPKQEYNNYFVEGEYAFLKDIKDIKELVLGQKWNEYIIDYDFLSSLKNVSVLDIYACAFSNLEAEKISFVKKLIINGLPYDIPISLSKNDIDYLKRKTVLVLENESKIEEVNNIIEEIALSLNVDKNSSDKEKLNAILNYVLNNYEYPANPSNISGYYIKGYLDASLNSERQICGNYSSMVSALANYLSLESYNLYSENHAWNLVKIDNEYFYVDATYIDAEYVDIDMLIESSSKDNIISNQIVKAEQAFANNDLDAIDSLDWYLRKTNYTHDKEHIGLNMPPNIYPSKSQNIDNGIDLTSKKYIIKFNEKKYVVDALKLLLILSLFGGSIYIGIKPILKDKSIKKRNNN